ncbi:MAG TPA: VOC family protein [Candidatus Elarobacter sp.]|jgi:uncharacterized glyoxalase superfamily protein PhnB
MTDGKPLTSQRIFCGMRFVDAHAGIAFLQRAFGFEPQAVYDDGAGGVAHAQLVLKGQIVMLGSSRDDDYPVRSPMEVGAVTGGVYVVLDDAAEVDAMHARAVAAGAEILMPLHDTDYGSHDFLARDPEGHLWSFGTYRPAAP